MGHEVGVVAHALFAVVVLEDTSDLLGHEAGGVESHALFVVVELTIKTVSSGQFL